MQNAYASWIGQAVVLQVITADLRVPLRGIIVGESDSAVRFRIGEGWDIDVFKSMILAVEQDECAASLLKVINYVNGDWLPLHSASYFHCYVNEGLQFLPKYSQWMKPLTGYIERRLFRAHLKEEQYICYLEIYHWESIIPGIV